MNILVIVLLFATAFIIGAKSIQQCPLSRSGIERALHEAYIPGLVAIVVNSTDVLYNEAFDYQSPSITIQYLSMDSNRSIFVTASISKTLISHGAMQLVESHQLDLDKGINEYLSPYPKVAHPLHPINRITMRNLLSHMSSIGPNLDEELKEIYIPGDNFTPTNPADVVKTSLRVKRKIGFLKHLVRRHFIQM